jgi:hypothetical protein
MALRGFDPDEVIEFIPEYANNSNSDNPVIVGTKFVSYAKQKHYGRLIAYRTKNLNNVAKVLEGQHGVQRKQFLDNIVFIKNYEIVKNGEPLEVGDNRERIEHFYDHEDSELIEEIITTMESKSKLTEKQRKNS